MIFFVVKDLKSGQKIIVWEISHKIPTKKGTARECHYTLTFLNLYI